MSDAPQTSFKQRVDTALRDEPLRNAVQFTADRLRTKKRASASALGSWEEWRELGRRIRTHTIDNLDYYLDQFTTNAEAAGATIHFADDADAAVKISLEIARQQGAKLVIKSKSMVSEEVGLNHELNAADIRCVETDLGEYIIQLAGEMPSHIIVPAIHKTRAQIAALFTNAGGVGLTTDTESLAKFATATLRREFLAADIGFTGCNFAIAETGSVCIFSNEGNARMTSTMPKTHIVLMGMERILPSLADLAVLAKLLPRSGTGQKLTAYMTLLTGPRRVGELDGAEAMHIIVVDNGRSRQLGDPEFQDVLNCIRCGACLNVCPVYQQIGGHAYGSVYPGPIGAVLTPLLHPESAEARELPNASSLCGACSEACPVKIPLHDMLVHLRRRNVEAGNTSAGERAAFGGFGSVYKSAGRYRAVVKVLNVIQRATVKEGNHGGAMGPLADWNRERELPFNGGQSFHDLWPRLKEELDGKQG